jgi:hypothetical protein
MEIYNTCKVAGTLSSKRLFVLPNGKKKFKIVIDFTPESRSAIFEVKDSIVPYLERLKEGDFVNVSFNPSFVTTKSGEFIAVNNAYRIELVTASF